MLEPESISKGRKNHHKLAGETKTISIKNTVEISPQTKSENDILKTNHDPKELQEVEVNPPEIVEPKEEGIPQWDTISNQSKSSLSIGRFGDLKSLKLLSDKNAIHLTRILFNSLSNQQGTIKMESFTKLFNEKKEAKMAFELFDTDLNGELSYSEVKQTILKIYREKRDLLKTLRDLSQALGQLNLILYGFVVCLTVICMLPIYGIPVEAVLPFTSIIIAFSFIFGGSARSTFESIIFLFVNHPYDTGTFKIT
jgi:hypothetical protein